jgi:arylsulfatase A-like enzyme
MKKLNISIFLFFLTCVSLAQTKPNILWITIEDTSPQFIGCYGNRNARTPVMDSLAKKGIRFTNAFSTGTVCAPSRSTIITGVRSYKIGTGNHRSNYPIPGIIHGFPYYLRQAGYYTTNNSKTDYNVADADKMIAEVWNESSTKAGWWNRKPGQPFFAVFNYMDSHQSRTMTLPFSEYEKKVLDFLPKTEQISENEFDMPPFYRDSREMRKQLARVYNALKLTDNKIGELLKRLEQDHLKDSTIIILFADHGEGIPRGKTNGINLGYHVPFIICFPPTYQNLSPWRTKGIITSEMIDFEDLAPTMINLAGGKIPEYLNGRIFMGPNPSKPLDHLFLSSDRSDNGIDMVRSITDGKFLYSRNFMPFMPQARYIRYMEIGDIKQQMRKDLMDGKLNSLQKSLFEERPAEFLFDIENDSWETNNLANNPKYKSVVKQMRNQLAKDILRSRDILFLPEYEIDLISKTTTPYVYRLSNENYPIQEIFQAASLSGMRGEKTALQQTELLKSKNKIVRYWASIGLRSQSPSIIKLFKQNILNSMKDDYPPVAITASTIAYQEFNNQTAKENLKLYINSNNMHLALMTINYLLYIKDKEPFINTIQSIRSLKDRSYDVKAACLDFLGSLGLVPNTPNYEE